MSSKNNPEVPPESAALPKSADALIAEIKREWDKAEEVVKLAELVCEDVIIPAVAELRYAGRRLVDALNGQATGKTEGEVIALVEDARFCCFRSRHDAIDAALGRMALEIDVLANAMGYDVVHNSYPDFVAYVQRLTSARRQIAISRGDRNNREAIYESLVATDFSKLVDDHLALKTSETTMRIIVDRKRLTIWLGIIASLAIAIPGYVMSWYFWKYPAL